MGSNEKRKETQQCQAIQALRILNVQNAKGQWFLELTAERELNFGAVRVFLNAGELEIHKVYREKNVTYQKKAKNLSGKGDTINMTQDFYAGFISGFTFLAVVIAMFQIGINKGVEISIRMIDEYPAARNVLVKNKTQAGKLAWISEATRK